MPERGGDVRIMLLFPPGWSPYTPYLALPRLTAYLREQGYEVIQRDLNLELYELTLRPEFLQASLDQMRQAIQYLPEQATRPLRLLETSGDYLVSHVEQLTEFFRSEAFYGDPATTARNVRLLETGIRLALGSTFLAGWATHDGTSPYTASVAEIQQAVSDEGSNAMLPILRDHFLDSILDAQPDLVGISISSFRQIVPALTLAALVKERRPDLHVVLGGNTAWRICETLECRAEEFFDHLFDSLVLGEGELPLVGLAEAVAGRRELSEVPGLVYRGPDGEVRRNPEALLDIDTLPTPDFDGLPLDGYLAPALMLPLVTSRGCHWARCTFCDRHLPGAPQDYQVRRDERVIEDIRRLQEKHGVRYVQFNDDDMSPTQLVELSRRILDAGLDVEWFVFQRLEKELTEEACRVAYQAGCRMLRFGLESGNPRVLRLMKKGITLPQAEKALHNSSRAGIWNVCCAIVGFPGEQPQEAEDTLNFIAGHAEDVHWVNLSPYALTRYSTVFQRPEDFGVRRLDALDDAFKRSFVFEVDDGLGMHEARETTKRFYQQLRCIHPYHDFCDMVGEECLFLYQAVRGRDVVRSIVWERPVDEEDWRAQVFQLRVGVTIREIDGRTVLHDLVTGRRFALRPAARRFVELCQRGMPAGQAAQAVAQANNLSLEGVEQRCLELLKLLAKGGSVRWE